MVEPVGKDCTGCKACGDSCPVNAIQYIVNEDGFWYPKVDKSRCIECGKCVRTCPILTKVRNEGNNSPKVYSVWSKTEAVRFNSTSGGAYYEFARMFLKNGGYIAGCIYTESLDGAQHIVTKEFSGLEKIMRSKYFQSDTETIFIKIEKLLKKGERVLFCGTPCQSAALKNYLDYDYENLYRIDFVCRGINSPLAYNAYIKELERKYKSKVKEVRFKDKSNGWINLGTKVIFQNGKEYFRNKFNDPWVNGYVSGNLFLRTSCTKCAFKQIPRISDISLGDFWGIQADADDLYKGISLLMINSDKGMKLFQETCEEFVYQEQTLETAVAGNICILKPAPYNEKRKKFFEMINSGWQFSTAVWDALELKTPRRQLGNLKYYIKKWLESHFRNR